MRFSFEDGTKTLLNVPATENMLDRLYDIMGAQATELVELKWPPEDEARPVASAGAVGSARQISHEERAMIFTCSSTTVRSAQAHSFKPSVEATKRASCKVAIHWLLSTSSALRMKWM